MVTTGLLSRNDPAARPTLCTAARPGIPRFNIGYCRYRDFDDRAGHLARIKADVEGLAAVAGHAGIAAGFQNHSGTHAGSALWDHWWNLRDTDPQQVGFCFDPCHATIEGGSAGWRIGFHRLKDRLRMVACKDFRWERIEGRRKARMCPLGQGMVGYPKFFRMLAASGFAARSPCMSSTGSRHSPRPSASTGRCRRSRRTPDTCARSSKRRSDDFLRPRPPAERPAPAATGA